MSDDCQEDIYGNRFYLINLLPFSNTKVFMYSSMILIYFNIKHYILYFAMKGVESKNFLECDRKIKVVALTVLNLLHFLFYFFVKDNILSIDGPSLVKTFSILIIVDWLYFTLKKIIRYLVNFYEVFLFFILNWILVAAILEVVFVAFPKYYDHPQFYSFNYTSYFKSLFSVFVFFTTNNSPETLMKDFSQNKVVMPIMVTVVFVNNLLIIALVIGLAYYKMKLSMAEEIRKMTQNPLKLAVFRQLEDHPDISKIFIKKVIIMHLENKNPQLIEVDKLMEEEEEAQYVQTRASEHIFSILKGLKSYELLYAFIDLFLVCFALFVIHTKSFEKYHYFLFSVLLSSVVLLDFLHHAFFHDIWNFDKTWKTVTDTILSIAIIVLAFSIIADRGHSLVLIKFWSFFCVCKSFRFFMLYFRFDRTNIKSHVMYPFFRFIYDIITQQTLIFIVFASIGFNVFGGKISSHSIENYNTFLNTDFDTTAMNLNTFVNSLIFFFVVTINNDWPVLANMAVVGDPNKGRFMKFLFIGFKIYMNYILLNSLIAFIIEILYKYKSRKGTDLIETQKDELVGIIDDSLHRELDQPVQ